MASVDNKWTVTVPKSLPGGKDLEVNVTESDGLYEIGFSEFVKPGGNWAVVGKTDLSHGDVFVPTDVVKHSDKDFFRADMSELCASLALGALVREAVDAGSTVEQAVHAFAKDVCAGAFVLVASPNDPACFGRTRLSIGDADSRAAEIRRVFSDERFGGMKPTTDEIEGIVRGDKAVAVAVTKRLMEAAVAAGGKLTEPVDVAEQAERVAAQGTEASFAPTDVLHRVLAASVAIQKPAERSAESLKLLRVLALRTPMKGRVPRGFRCYLDDVVATAVIDALLAGGEPDPKDVALLVAMLARASFLHGHCLDAIGKLALITLAPDLLVAFGIDIEVADGSEATQPTMLFFRTLAGTCDDKCEKAAAHLAKVPVPAEGEADLDFSALPEWRADLSAALIALVKGQ